MMDFTPKKTDLLVIIDVQRDFMEGGALAVPDANAILPVIDEVAAKFDNLVMAQDWHPAGHSSFASTHAGKAPFQTTNMAYGIQVLWPDHCMQGTPGAELMLPDTLQQRAEAVIRKGYRPEIDSYSAFMENDQKTPTGLGGYMRERGFERAVFVGLALDFCVGFSALDARKLGFEAVVIEAGCRGIAQDSVDEMKAKMAAAGVTLV
jgi:nicotinamidase/pyrazinamidase